MRFACDRCKTRYSIADERVRGKILKIRCKTCANVITVKEGMEAPAEEQAQAAASPTPASWPERDRAFRPTTMAPQSTVSAGGGMAPLTPAPAPKPAPALASAFATAMAEPQAPPQLEDEWYVSRDGEQQGPFGLHNAQAWVSQQPYEAELFCWCEGFDDWLPVDRIAHFRGLRARTLPAPATSAVPTAAQRSAALSGPLPALSTRAHRPTGANPASSAGASGLSTIPSAVGTGGRAAMSDSAVTAAAAPAAALGNGVGANGANGVDDKPQFAAPMAALAGEPSLPAATPPPQLAAPAGWPAQPASSGNGFGHAARGAFDAGDLGSQGFGADAGLSGRRATGSTAPPDTGAATNGESAPAASASASMPGISSFDDELEFGEVSRVVRIADIGKAVRPQQQGRGAPAPAAARRTGANDVLPAASSGLSSAPPSSFAGGLGIPQPVSAASGGELSSRVVVPLAVPAAQRRTHSLLLGLVALGLIGAGVAAFFILQSSGTDDPTMISLSGRNISDLTIRPDDPRRGTGVGAGTGAAVPEPAGSGATGATRPAGGTIRRPGPGSGAITTNPQPGTGGKVETAPTQSPATPLGGDEVEDMSQRNSSGLQRCYEQALKKDIFLEVKSIKVTISIDTNGIVTNVAMSSHSDHALGQCMIARIRNWRFRANSRGLDAKFTVAFGRT